MKILFVSAGIVPKRAGGLPAYLTELMAALAARGENLVYLDPGCISSQPKTYLRRFEGNPVRYELYNCGIVPELGRGTREPLRQVEASPKTRELVLEMIDREKPQVVHFQEFISFPIDLLRDIKARGIFIIFTAHDYYTLCPTTKLFHRGNYPCTLEAQKLDCDVCCAGAASRTAFYMSNIAVPALKNHPRIRQPVERFVSSFSAQSARREYYVQRRLDFVKALNAMDRVHCISKLQAQVFLNAGVLPEKIIRMYLSRQTFATATPPARAVKQGGPFKFIGSNLEQVAKGMLVVEREFRILAEQKVGVELDMYGGLPPLISGPLIHFRGAYGPENLDDICASADAGLVPSVWWETYGYVGVEMLTRGLPVFVSSRGAMVEYVRDQENGVIFDPDQPGALAAVIRKFVEDGEFRARITAGAARDYACFQSFSSHVDDVQGMYAQLFGGTVRS